MLDYTKFLSLDKLPKNVSKLENEENIKSDVTDAVLFINRRTKHLYLESGISDDYYDDYLMTATYSTKMQNHQEGQSKKLARLNTLETSNFIEIGCGDGSFLKHASQHFNNISGIEPSGVFAREAKNKGFDVIECYVNQDSKFSDRKYDAFASRQVFEHLENPLDVLIGIRNNLNSGAVGLIEVPNGLRSLLENRYYDFFPDHCQYYSVNSLTQLASDAGFIVLSCNTTFGDDYLELWLKYEPNMENLSKKLLDVRTRTIDSLKLFIENASQQGKSLAIWGVGAKTLATFACLNNTEAIAFAIDSDPHKHDKYIPGTAVQVKPPSQLTNSVIDIVLILALSYREEIKQSVVELSDGKSEVWTIDNSSNLVKL